jgi:putative endopeptidase
MRIFVRSFGLLTLLTGLATAASFLKEPAPRSGIERANFDLDVKPGDDFYQYVNGKWIKANPIPAEYSRWGAFMKLGDDNRLILRKLVEDLSNKPASALDENSRKLRDFYRTAMDEAKLQSQGAAPLADELKRIGEVKDADSLLATIAQLHSQGIRSLFGFSVGQDEKQSTHYAVYLHQGGLGLPEREYYLGKTEDSKRILAKYERHVAKMLELLGDKPDAAKDGAAAVLKIETKLAEACRTPVQLRDREANYNRRTLAELATMTPNLKWDVYWKSLGVPAIAGVIVGQPEFYERVNELVATVPMAEWQTYLRWHLLSSTASYLSDPLVNESQHFYGEMLRGQKKIQPRWKRAIGALDGHLGEALGKLYVDNYFPPESKQRMDRLVKNVMAAYKQRIEAVDWMGPETKKQALAKLATVMPKIGYPDKWRDYSSVEIGTDSYVQNALRCNAFEVRREINKLGKPVDRTEWGMTPPTVNAYYNPSLNEIVFPAGILQPPFFDATADEAVNYGAIGAVIGHEITHGFDDQGSRSDAEGNLRNWWTAEDRKRFNAKADELVKQYDACKVLDDLHVNGRLTLGENLADLGGVTIAYAAYQESLKGKPAPWIDGFTGPQRFFIGFAQVWRGAALDAEARLLLRTDPHSPFRFRTLVPLSNTEAFYDAFDIKPGDPIYRKPADRVQVW